ncbi:hypothetical protein ACTUSZ_02955 [Pantoea eucalypti]|uniref:hypothetical protein n=1 Tax=Pantoea eucalypti TaxID=470933 RepID=UPI003FA45DA1
MGFEDFISKVLVGSLSGLIIAYFTARYALDRFYREKWWDKRASLYVQLVESIYAIKKASIYWYEEEISKKSGFSERSFELDAEEIKILQAEHDKAVIDLMRISDLSPLLLNEQCKILIDNYLEQRTNLYNRFNYDAIEIDDAVSESLDNVVALLDSIMTEARKELRSDHKSFKEQLKPGIEYLRDKLKALKK